MDNDLIRLSDFKIPTESLSDVWALMAKSLGLLSEGNSTAVCVGSVSEACRTCPYHQTKPNCCQCSLCFEREL